MGTEPGQALTLICDYEKSKFYIVSLDMNGLDTLGYFSRNGLGYDDSISQRENGERKANLFL